MLGLNDVWVEGMKSSGCSKVGLNGSTSLFEFIMFFLCSFNISMSLLMLLEVDSLFLFERLTFLNDLACDLN